MTLPDRVFRLDEENALRAWVGRSSTATMASGTSTRALELPSGTRTTASRTASG